MEKIESTQERELTKEEMEAKQRNNEMKKLKLELEETKEKNIKLNNEVMYI